jgi:hypothetical protein
MNHTQRWLTGALLIASVVFAGCKSAGGPEEAAADETRPATVEHGEGSQPTRVTLTEDAYKKIDVQTVAVRSETVDGSSHTVIPYGAVLYDQDGDTWTYTNPEPRVFVRFHITIDHITDGLAVLSDGPAAGVPVVTVGSAELYGAESEFEEE